MPQASTNLHAHLSCAQRKRDSLTAGNTQFSQGRAFWGRVGVYHPCTKKCQGPRIFGATRPFLAIKLNTTINKITKFVVFSNSHFDLLEAYA